MQHFEPIACWNGEITLLSQVRIPALDRGFLFGDGVYEVIRLYKNRPFLLERHLERLQYSLGELSIAHNTSVTTHRLAQLLQKTPKEDGYVYIQITRGATMRSHLFPKDCVPNELIYVALQSDPLGPYRKTGIGVILAEDIRWHRPDIKSVNLLANVLIRQRAAEAGAQEAILIRWDGRVTEATSSNVFIVKNSVVITPQSDHWILDGISRRFVRELCDRHGLRFTESAVKKEDLMNCDEIFLSSTFSEVIPVTRLENREIFRGPITARLITLFRSAVEDWLSNG